MKLAQVAELRRVAKAQFECDAMELRRTVQDEMRLRGALADLDDAEAKRAVACSGGLEIAFAQAGAALWQGWAEKRRRELNHLLMHQLALKEEAMTRARKSFGKSSALKSLESQERTRTVESAKRREIDTLLELECNKRWNSV